MKPLFILLAQSTTGPIIEIVLLLLGAVLIGFLTAWFYQKSVYTPVIRKLEAEKEDLNKKIEGLNNDIIGFKAKIGDLEKTIKEKENALIEKDKEIELLKKPKK
jgi:peptidoglycan hydrolase CwlO-like protein